MADMATWFASTRPVLTNPSKIENLMNSALGILNWKLGQSATSVVNPTTARLCVAGNKVWSVRDF
jgi:hypothetical protein